MTELREQNKLVRQAARGLANAGLVNAFGHCSLRLDERYLLVCAPKPMGMIQASDLGTIVDINAPLPDHVLGEVRIHQAIYKVRPDVNGICRVFPPNVLALAAMERTPRARHGFGSYFYPQVPLYKDTGLVRNEIAAQSVAQELGDACAIVVSINGALTVADNIKKACVLAWFLEDAARVELTCLNAAMEHIDIFKDRATAENRATWSGGIMDRMWSYMTRDDPELNIEVN
jgi:HCOMODA/2-hydroxy-3-carboxy-muconic semialdehyde decarboxylase